MFFFELFNINMEPKRGKLTDKTVNEICAFTKVSQASFYRKLKEREINML